MSGFIGHLVEKLIKWNYVANGMNKSNMLDKLTVKYFLAGTYYTQLRGGDMSSSTSVMKRSHSSPNIAQVRMFILLAFMCMWMYM